MQHEILDEIEVHRKEFGITKGLFIMVLAAFLILFFSHFYRIFTLLDLLPQVEFGSNIFLELITLFAGLYYLRFRANIYRALELNRIAIITNLLMWCHAISVIFQRVLLSYFDFDAFGTSFITITQLIGYLNIILIIAESILVLVVPQITMSLNFKYLRQVAMANLIVMSLAVVIYTIFSSAIDMMEITEVFNYPAYKVIPVFYLLVNSIPDILQLRAAFKFMQEAEDESPSPVE